MKIINPCCLAFLLFFSSSIVWAQASGYFPVPGFQWHYQQFTIGGNDTIISQGEMYETVLDRDTIDGQPCFPVENNLRLPPSPVISYYAGFNGTDALVKMKFFSFDSLIDLPGRWLTMFKFGALPPFNSWVIFEADTTIQYDSITLPVTIKISGARTSLNSSVTVPAGNFTSALFIIKEEIGTQVGPVFVPFVTSLDSFWIAPNLWIVKRVRPALSFSLPDTLADSLTISIPGMKQELVSFNQPDEVQDHNISFTDFQLFSNYPNPFNPTTVITYQLAAGSWVMLKVYNVLGEEVATLVDEMQFAGYKTVKFSADDHSGLSLPSGIYFYSLTAGGIVETRKMILIR